MLKDVHLAKALSLSPGRYFWAFLWVMFVVMVSVHVRTICTKAIGWGGKSKKKDMVSSKTTVFAALGNAAETPDFLRPERQVRQLLETRRDQVDGLEIGQYVRDFSIFCLGACCTVKVLCSKASSFGKISRLLKFKLVRSWHSLLFFAVGICFSFVLCECTGHNNPTEQN